MEHIKILDFCDKIDDEWKIEYFDNTIDIDGMFDPVQFYEIKKEIKKKWFQGIVSKSKYDDIKTIFNSDLPTVKFPKVNFTFSSVKHSKIYIPFYGEYFYIRCFEDVIILIEFFATIVEINTNKLHEISEENYNIVVDLFTYLKSICNEKIKECDFIYRKVKYLYHPDYKQNKNHLLGLQTSSIKTKSLAN